MTQIYRFIEASVSPFIDLLVKIDRILNMSGWRPTFHRGARQSDLYILTNLRLLGNLIKSQVSKIRKNKNYKSRF